MLDVETEIAEVGLWLANYQRVGRMEYRDRLFQRADQVRAGLQRLKALDLTRDERSPTGRPAERRLDRTMGQIRHLLRSDAHVRERVRKFGALATEMDHILDEQVQAAAQQNLGVPAKAAEAAVLGVADRIRVLIPAFVLAAIAVGFLLVRVITEPVKALATGTKAVARGDLTYRVEPTGKDAGRSWPASSTGRSPSWRRRPSPSESWKQASRS